MPASITTQLPAAAGSWKILAIPLAVLGAAVALTLVLYSRFVTLLEVLAPAALLLCVLAAIGGVLQRKISARRARHRSLRYNEVARILDHLAAGEITHDAIAIGRNWRTLDAARAIAAARPDHEQELIRLGLRRSGAGRPVARRAVGSPRKWERVRALHDIGWLGLSEMMPVLGRAVSDDDDDVAWAGISALGGSTDDDAYDALLDVLSEGRFAASRIAQVLETSRHPQPLKLLLRRIPESTPAQLFWITYLLGRTGDSAALDTLLRLADHADANVRANAAEALGAHGDAAVEARLRQMAEDPAWYVRLHACRALGDIRATGSIGVLTNAADDRSWWVRRAAIEALRRIRDTA